jgi:hypothetical protein
MLAEISPLRLRKQGTLRRARQEIRVAILFVMTSLVIGSVATVLGITGSRVTVSVGHVALSSAWKQQETIQFSTVAESLITNHA